MMLSKDAFTILTPSEVRNKLVGVVLDLFGLTEATSNSGSLVAVLSACAADPL